MIPFARGPHDDAVYADVETVAADFLPRRYRHTFEEWRALGKCGACRAISLVAPKGAVTTGAVRLLLQLISSLACVANARLLSARASKRPATLIAVSQRDGNPPKLWHN